MDHSVAVSAQDREILQLCLRLSRLVQRGAMVDFAVIPAMVPVHNSEVKTTHLALEGLPTFMHRVDLSLSQTSVAFADKVLTQVQSAFVDAFEIVLCRRD